MNHMLFGLRHVHTRKCGHAPQDPIPSQKTLIRFVDRLAYLSVIVPIMTIPQFVTIFANHDASNLSLVTWGTYLISATYWTYYGWLHKAKPIWIPNILMVFVDIAVVVGILLYG
jgi:uncharacterized protein with PQ loop repeat